jgi:hypothetical protein
MRSKPESLEQNSSLTNSIVIRNYSKVIDQVCLKEFGKAAGDDCEVLKGTKYLLLKNRENLIEE